VAYWWRGTGSARGEVFKVSWTVQRLKLPDGKD
jgi:hypothetical protein